MADITIIGAGVAGLACAVELVAAGAKVTILERGCEPGPQTCGWFAGGMLSPWCEKVTTDAAVAELGQHSCEWWDRHTRMATRQGSLVVAMPRDQQELSTFAARTSHHQWLSKDALAALEPDLSASFTGALYFPDEGHLEPRLLLPAMIERLREMGVDFRFGVTMPTADLTRNVVLDCRGLAARETLTELRGVRGEMVLLETPDISLSRPVRLLHPRGQIYVIPRENHRFMVGGTVIESDDAGAVTVRSVMQLLNGAYVLHPAFAEARLVETGVGVRPAMPDNLPHLIKRQGRWYLNGLFRHGFLLAPALAAQVVSRFREEGVMA